MKFEWEEVDFTESSGNGSRLAISSAGEVVLLTRGGCTSLVDGHRFFVDLAIEVLINNLNDGAYVPILDHPNAHNVILNRPRIPIDRS